MWYGLFSKSFSHGVDPVLLVNWQIDASPFPRIPIFAAKRESHYVLARVHILCFVVCHRRWRALWCSKSWRKEGSNAGARTISEPLACSRSRGWLLMNIHQKCWWSIRTSEPSSRDDVVDGSSVGGLRRLDWRLEQGMQERKSYLASSVNLEYISRYRVCVCVYHVPFRRGVGCL